MHTPTPEKNCPFPFGDPGPCILYGSLDTAESTSQTASWSVQLIWQSSRLTYRHTHTERGTLVTIGCIFACDSAQQLHFSVLFRNRPHHGGGFFMGKNFMWHQPVGNVAVIGCSCDFLLFTSSDFCLFLCSGEKIHSVWLWLLILMAQPMAHCTGMTVTQ